jgi:hypothetical protein
VVAGTPVFVPVARLSSPPSEASSGRPQYGIICLCESLHGLVEFDITLASETIRRRKVEAGESFSFSAFFLPCLGKAIDSDRHMHAYRSWRRQLILFDEVDVNMLFEVVVDGKKTIRKGMPCLALCHTE